VNSQDLKKRILVFVAMLSACIGHSFAAVNDGAALTNISVGLQSLTLQTRAGLVSADRAFALALTNNPTNSMALTLKSITGLAVLQENPEFVQLLTHMGVIQPQQSIYHLDYKTPTDQYGSAVVSGTMSNVISYIDTTLRPQLSNSISQLSRVSTNVSFTLTGQQTGTLPVAVDYGDVQLALSALYLAEAISYTEDRYNFGITLNDVSKALSGEITIEEILVKYPLLLGLGSNNRRGEAKQALISANAAFQRAVGFIPNQRKPRFDYPNVFSIDKNDPKAMEGLVSMGRRFNALAAAFVSPQVFPADATSPTLLDGKTINMGIWASTQTPPRSWLGTNSFWGDLYNPGTLTDPTFSGILPDMTQELWSGYMQQQNRLRFIAEGALLESDGAFLKGPQPSWDPLLTEGNILAGTYVTSTHGISGNPTGYGFLYDGSHYTAIEYPMAQFTRISGMADGKIWGTYTKGSIDASYIYSNGGFRDIRYPGAESTYISELEDGGVVIGWYWNETQHSFIYDGTSYRDITFPGANNTWIRGKSGNLIWGSYSDSNWQWHGFLFDGTNYTSIDYPGATYTSIYGGVGGKIWGYYNDANYTGGSFLYENGHYSEFQYPGANYTWINSSWNNGSNNKAVGSYGDNTGSHGFIYDGSTFTTVDYPQSYNTQITGYSGNKYWGSFSGYSGSGVFLYENGVVNTINVPGGYSYSTWISDVSGSNVIGSYWNGSEQKAFVYNGSTFATISYPGANNTYLNEAGSKWVTGSYSSNGYGGAFAYPLASIVPDPVASPIAIGGNTGISSYTNTASNGIVSSGPVSMNGNATIVYTNPSATIQSTGAVSITGTNNLISLSGGYLNGSTNVLISGTSLTAYYASSIAVTGPAVGNGTLSLGGSYTNAGSILSLQADSNSLYLTVTQNTNPLSQGLVAYYPLNGSFNDMSGSGNNMTSYQGMSFTNDHFGNSNAAVLMNSTTSFASSMNQIGISGNSPRSVSFWMKTTTSVNSAHYNPVDVMGWGRNLDGTIVNGEAFIITLYAPSVGGGVNIQGGAADLVANTNVADASYNNWCHVAYIYNGSVSGTMVYVNGSNVPVSTPYYNLLNELNTPDAEFRLGDRGDGRGLALPGTSISQVRIYNRALSAAEVGQLYAAEVGDLDSDGDGLPDAYEQGQARYEVIQGNFTWDQAKADAESRTNAYGVKGHLATITSEEEWEISKRVVVSHPAMEIWIGGAIDNSKGQWRWVTSEPWNYSKWLAGEGNISNGEPFSVLSSDEAGNITGWDDWGASWQYSKASYLLEYGYPTDPYKSDSDGDGYDDKTEQLAGTDPNDAVSNPAPVESNDGLLNLSFTEPVGSPLASLQKLTGFSGNTNGNSIVSPTLTYRSAYSIGNSLELDNDAEAVFQLNRTSVDPIVENNNTYVSAIIKVSSAKSLSSSGMRVLSLRGGSNNVPVASLWMRDTGGKIQLGMQRAGIAVSWGELIDYNKTSMIVMKYAWEAPFGRPGGLHAWVLPSYDYLLDSGDEGVPTNASFWTYTYQDSYLPKTLVLEGHNEATIGIDEINVGLTWATVVRKQSSIVPATSDLYVGSNTPNNSLVLGSGTSTYRNTYVGFQNGSSNNQLTIGGGSTQSLAGALIAHYPLQGNGSDLSGNGNNATVNYATPTTDRFGNSNGALFFNGTNAYLEASHQQYLNTLPITISCWFSRYDTNSKGTLMGRYVNQSWNGYNLSYGDLSGTNSIIPFYARSYGNDISDGYDSTGNNPLYFSKPLNDTNWHLATMTVDTNGSVLYIDGVADTNRAWRGAPMVTTATTPLLIGGEFNPDGQSIGDWSLFHGSISDVRIYSRALASNEVERLYKYNGLIAHYPLHGNGNDLSGNGNNATVNYATPTMDRFGNSNGALFFNGTNAYLEAAHQEYLNTLPITISCWFSRNDTNSKGTFVGKYVTQSWDGYAMGYADLSGTNSVVPFYARNYGNDISDGYDSTGENPLYFSKPITDTNWHLATMTVDTNGSVLYIDGIADTNRAWRGAPLVTTTTTPLKIGAQLDPSAQQTAFHFHGSLSDVRIYNRALAPNEVAELYTQEEGDMDSDGDGLTDDWERGKGRYQIVRGSWNYEEASSDAANRTAQFDQGTNAVIRGHLATITTPKEQTFIRSFIEGQSHDDVTVDMLIGASDAAKEGDWRWITGEKWSYTNWHNTEPNNRTEPGLPNGENYLSYVIRWNHEWVDIPYGGNGWSGDYKPSAYLLEYGYPSDPYSSDSDGDGYDDKRETLDGTDPNDATSHRSVLINTNNTYVGYDGSGNSLVVTNGALLQDVRGYIGTTTNSSNNIVIVTGTNSAWINSENLYVGNDGSYNSLVVSNGGLVVGTNSSIGAEVTSSNNSVFVTGLCSAFASADTLQVGGAGSGNTMAIADEGIVYNSNGVIGNTGNSNSVEVHGLYSQWTNSGNLTIGNLGAGNRLAVSNAASVTSAGGVIGNGVLASNNSVHISGVSEPFLWPESVVIGVETGYTTDQNGNMISTFGPITNGPTTNFIARSIPSTWSNTGSLIVGNEGIGNTMTITDGGLASSSNAVIGKHATSSNNSVIVSGTSMVSIGYPSDQPPPITIEHPIAMPPTLMPPVPTPLPPISINPYPPIFIGTNIVIGGPTIGSGTLILNTNNYYNGIGVITNGWIGTIGGPTTGSGTLILNTNNYYNGIGVITNGSQTLGTLTLTGNSVINFSGLTGSSSLTISSIAGLSTSSLSIYNWSSADGDSLHLNQAVGGLSAAELSNISFYSGEGTGFLGTGSFSGSEIVPGTNAQVMMPGQLTLGTNATTLPYTNGTVILGPDIFTNRSTWHAGSDLVVGDAGSGNNLSISNGGLVTSANGMISSRSSASNNSVLVAGNNSVWTNSGIITVGYAGNGTLTVAEGGQVLGSGLVLASEAGSSATINYGVYGANGRAGDINVGGNVTFGAGSWTANFNQSDQVVVFSSTPTGNGVVNQLGTGTTVITGDASQFSGPINIENGTFVVGDGDALSSMYGFGTKAPVGPIVNNSILVFNPSGPTNVEIIPGWLFGSSPGDVYQVPGVISGTGTVVQHGPGTTILSAANTYTGPTRVDAGNLQITGSLNTYGTVTVNLGGTLSGTGSVGNVTVNSGGTIAPGTGMISTPSTTGQVISRQPVSRISSEGSNVTFDVRVAANVALKYQWLKNGMPLTGATNPSLTLNGISQSDAGSYSVTIISSNDTLTSAPAQLVVGESRVIYVNASAAGANDGSSWYDAYTDLNSALNTSQQGDQVWIAAGTYYPTLDDNRWASFTMSSFISIYGGFRGDETDISQRDWECNSTILSGNLPSGTKSFQICKIMPNATATIDGVTVTAGEAPGGGVYPDAGAAIFQLDGSVLVVQNCKLENNTTIAKGGAIYNDNHSALSVFDCVFTNNTATVWGGGGIRSGGQLIVDRCLFVGNSGCQGAAIKEEEIQRCYVANSVFKGNQTMAGGDPSSQGIIGSWPSVSCSYILNCTFVDNLLHAQQDAVVVLPSIDSVLANNIFYRNGSNSITYTAGWIGNNLSDLTLNGNQNIKGTPEFVDIDNVTGADGVFGTADDGLYLADDSPGSGNSIPRYTPVTDASGNSRNPQLSDVGSYSFDEVTTESPTGIPKTLSLQSALWAPGGNYNWVLNDASGPAGTGYSSLNIASTLDLSQLSATNKFNINVSAGTDGVPLNFNGLVSTNWTIASFGSITNFSASNFAINTMATNGASGWSGLTNGTLGISTNGNNLELTYTAKSNGPDWQTPTGKRYSAVIYAKVLDENGNPITAYGSKLAVFDGNSVAGVASPAGGPGGTMLYQLTVFANQSSVNGMTYQVYDAATDVTSTLDETYNFSSGVNTGTIDNPIVLHVISKQIIPIYDGWTWISFHVMPTDNTWETLLKRYQPSDNDVIVGTKGSVTFYGGIWYPSSSDFKPESGVMYMISSEKSATIEAVGSKAPLPTLTLVSGWNWVGCPHSTSTTLLALMPSMQSSNNDVIISQESQMGEYSGGVWYNTTGDDFPIVPGMGYLIYLKTPQTVPLK
jgi:T5SS/PEP-CTERM-associated repeat protein/autotransporter-associated beta strand protein/predicted outer membrane repeat protein